MKENEMPVHILKQSYELKYKIGLGEVRAEQGIDSALKVARVREKLEKRIQRLENTLEIKKYKNSYPKLREKHMEGYLTDEEFLPYHNRMKELGLNDDETVLQDFIDLGIKGDQLRIVASLQGSSVANPKTPDMMAEELTIGWKDRRTGEINPSGHCVVQRFQSIREKLQKGGYILCSRVLDYKPGTSRGSRPNAYFIVKT